MRLDDATPIEVDDRGGQRFVLPRRRLTAGGGAALFALPIAVAILVTSASFDPIFTIVVGLMLIALLSFVLGRCEIVLTDDHRMRSTRRWMVLRWARSRPVNEIVELRLAPHMPVYLAVPGTRRKLEQASRSDRSQAGVRNEVDLVAVLEDGTCWTIADGYPRVWLVALADDLARRLNERSPRPDRPITVQDDTLLEEDLVDVEEPANAERFEIRRTGEAKSGLVITVRPSGWTPSLRKTRTSAAASILIGMALIGGAGLYIARSPGPIAVNVGVVAVPLIIIVLGLVSVRWCDRAAQLGVEVEAGEAGLDIRRTDRARDLSFARRDIAAVRTGIAGTYNPGSNPTRELQIHLRDGRIRGLLVGSDPQDLAWLATTLRLALDIPAF